MKGGKVWIEVTVDGETLSPRLPLNASPYAIRSGTAESLAEGASVESDQLPEELADGDDDVLGGMSCASGEIARYNGTNWTCGEEEVQWDNVNDVPPGLDDGDDDALRGLSCASGEIVRYNGTNWRCAEEVVQWSKVNGVPSGLDDGDDDTLRKLSCASGQVPLYDGSSWRCGEKAVQWQSVRNVPSDLADGDDDTLAGINCQQDQVAVYDGNQWACSDKPSDTLGGLSCPQGAVAQWDGSSWSCADKGIEGSGSADRLAKFSDSGTIEDSAVTQTNGNVGIGQTSPQAALDVDGGIKVGSGQSCDSSREGTIRYNDSESVLEVCTGQDWLTVGGNTTPTDCQEILNNNPKATSGTYEIDPDGPGGNQPFKVYCDMQTDGGGWIRVLDYDASQDGTSFSNHASQWTSVSNKMYAGNCSGPSNAITYHGNENCSNRGSSCETDYYRIDLSKFESAREVRFEHHDRVESWDAALMAEVDYQNNNVERRVYDNHGCTLPTGSCPSRSDISNTYDRAETYSGTGTKLDEFRWGVKWWQGSCGDRHEIYDYALYIR